MAITKTKAATECHIKAVASDPEFRKELNKLNGHANRNKIVSNLLKQYGLEFDDFDIHDNGFALLADPYKLFSAGYLEYAPERQEFIARFGSNIKRSQFEDLWKLIQKNKEKIGVAKVKLKPPQDSELLYAIFKARKTSRTFKDIFTDYQNGSLRLYIGKPMNQYSSEDELERYYHKFYGSIV